MKKKSVLIEILMKPFLELLFELLKVWVDMISRIQWQKYIQELKKEDFTGERK